MRREELYIPAQWLMSRRRREERRAGYWLLPSWPTDRRKNNRQNVAFSLFGRLETIKLTSSTICVSRVSTSRAQIVYYLTSRVSIQSWSQQRIIQYSTLWSSQIFVRNARDLVVIPSNNNKNNLQLMHVCIWNLEHQAHIGMKHKCYKLAQIIPLLY